MEIDGLTLEIGMVYKSEDPKNKEVWQIQKISEPELIERFVSGGYDERIPRGKWINGRPPITGKQIFWTKEEGAFDADGYPVLTIERVFLVRRDLRVEEPPWAVCLKKDFPKWLKDKGLSLVLDAAGDPVKNVQAVGIPPMPKKGQKVTS